MEITEIDRPPLYQDALPAELEYTARETLAARWEADGLIGEADDLRKNGAAGWALADYRTLLREAVYLLQVRVEQLEAQNAALFKIAAAGRDYGAGSLEDEVWSLVKKGKTASEIA